LAQKTDLSKLNCSVAGALSIVGDWWSLLIVRDALLGAERFSEFRQSLGLARNILADRLKSLTADEILIRQGSERRPRYKLTEKGRALAPVIVALMQWGDAWVSEGRAPVVVTDEAGETVDPMEIHAHGRRVAFRELRFRPGAGAEAGTMQYLEWMAPRVASRK